ncbi:MAG: pyridoxal phosphate-dependent aminotransferase, partial [Bryobacteraceae bacterium]
ERIVQAFADPRSMIYDPSSAGLWLARESVAALHGVAADRVLLTTGTSEAYSWLFKLLANPGDEVLVPRPSYPLFEFLAALESVTVRRYPLVYHEGWFVDFDALKEHLTERTRAIVVVNPNNPTGSYLKRDEWARLLAICRERSLAIISDEVFSDYALREGGWRVTTPADSGDVATFRLSGLSKAVGLPQMKLGWMLIGGAAPVCEQATERLELIADTYLSVGTPVQYALPALLDAKAEVQGQILERLRTNLQFLRAAVNGSRLRVLDVEGGWYATLRVPRIRTEEEWALRLLETNDVLVQPGYFYDFDSEAFLILSLLTRTEIFQEGTRRIVETDR